MQLLKDLDTHYPEGAVIRLILDANPFGAACGRSRKLLTLGGTWVESHDQRE